ncbi:MAG TPA: beta-ketoacyl synthase N-terminal-like domain-containing protein [Methylomirabilota bacterium]
MSATAAVRSSSAAPPAPRIRGIGAITGWGEGVKALADGSSEGGRRGERATGLVTAPTPVLGGDRFRRATRECLLAVAAAKAAVADAGLAESELAGPRTGILYVSATGYAAANRAFLEDETSTTLHFPYTSPSAVPGEVTIELGVRGPYVNLMGGAPATLLALWWAACWLAEGRADRLLVLAVEAFHEVRDLFGRARRLYAGPLVEGAACLLLEAGDGSVLRWGSALAGPAGARGTVAAVLERVLDGDRPGVVWSGATGASRETTESRILADRGAPAPTPRLGEALAIGPLLALARSDRAGAPKPWLLTATWRSEYAALLWAR